MQFQAAPAPSLGKATPGFPASDGDVSTVPASATAPSGIGPAPGQTAAGGFAKVA
jgi:hypothetical protein